MQSVARRSTEPPAILVVEDDHDSRVMMRSLLEDAGYVVHTAANGRDAVEKLSSPDVRPRLVIVDLNMPVMDGWELMGYLRSHPEHSLIPVGIQSADEDVTLPDGVAFVINKPVDVEALLTVIRHHCG
jgi:two-component system, chemotaxis family, chemotaxis protein CheY